LKLVPTALPFAYFLDPGAKATSLRLRQMALDGIGDGLRSMDEPAAEASSL
jgi:hypothetical protein